MTLTRLAIALAFTLGLALIVAQLSAPGDLGRNIAAMIGLMMCAVLVGPSVLARYELGEALRTLLIWAALLMLIVLAYTYKANFGF